MNISLSLSEQEAQVLINLMDAAVRAQGLQVAQPALVIVGKIQTAIQEIKKAPAPADSTIPAVGGDAEVPDAE